MTTLVIIAALISMLVAVHVPGTGAMPAAGAEETDNCTMVTLLYADEALTFVPVLGALTTAAAGARDGSGFTHASSTGTQWLPQGRPGSRTVAALADPGCGCLGSDVYLEVDIQVPHLTTKATRLHFMDDTGATVMDVAIPEEQQTRYVLDGDSLLNRIRVPLDQTAAPAGQLDRVTQVALERSGREDLANIDPVERPLVFWLVSSIRLRANCKECGSVPGSFRRENLAVALSPPGTEAALSSGSGTQLTAAPLDLCGVVDPGCRCLAPAPKPTASATVEWQVQLRHRNVWPHQLSIVEAEGLQRTLWTADLPRADPNSVGQWLTIKLPLLGGYNSWGVGPETADGSHGTLPPWHAVHVVMASRALTGSPSASDVPLVRNVALYSGADSLAGVYAATILHTSDWLAPSQGTTRLGPVDGFDTAWSNVQAVIDAGLTDPIADGAEAVLVAMLQQSEGATLQLGSLELLDGAGRSATIATPPATTTTASTLWVPLNATFITHEDAGFDWTDVASVSPHHHGPAASTSLAAQQAGSLLVTDMRIGVPRRLGHVSNPDNYNVDDLACDPLTGWFDMGVFVRHDPVRYGHCRECCCYFDNPGNPTQKHCYDQGDIISEVTPAADMAPNDQCAVCNRKHNPQIMSPRNTLLEDTGGGNATCDDSEPCTWNDQCRDDGACVAELYTTCLISDFWAGDPSKNCEVCDGSGPNSPTLGCQAKPGHYVYHPTSVNRTCGCFIDGVVHAHWALNPDFPCLRCDVTQSVTTWSEVPNDSKCDITAQYDWVNVPSQACTYKHICSDGLCGGIGYACPPLQACEAALDEFPHSCDLSGPASATGGCQRRTLPQGVVCAPQVHGCIPEALCTGIVGTCPPQIELPGIIYEDVGKQLRLRLPDGSDADTAFAVMPSLDSVVAAYDSFRVQCGDLQLRMAIIPNGDCATARVSSDLADGWGSGFTPPPRGSFAAITPPVAVAYVGSGAATELLPGDVASRGVPGDLSHYLVAVDAGVGDFTPALVSEFQAAGLADPFLDLQLRREHGVQLSTAVLHDSSNNTVRFKLPAVRVAAEWATVSGRGDSDGARTFDWSDVVGLSLERGGSEVLDGVQPGTPLFTIRYVRVRTRAQGPPCARADLVEQGSSLPLEWAPHQPSSSGVLAEANLTAAPVDLSAMYDQSLNSFADGTVLSLEVLPPAVGSAPMEVGIWGLDGAGLVARIPAASPAHAVGIDTPEWVRHTIPLRAGQLTVGVSDTTFQSTYRVTLRFGADEAANAPPSVRGVHITNGALCAHATESAVNGGKTFFGESSTAAAMVLEPQASSTALWLAGAASADVALPSLDIDLAELYDAACTCLRGGVLELEVTLPTLWVDLARLDIVQASTGHGVSLTELPPVVTPSQGAGASRRGVIAVSLDGAGATVVGPPAAWQSVDTLRLWRTLPADAPAAVVGDSVVVHSIAVRPTGVPCVTTTSLLQPGFTAPDGLIGSVQHEVVLGVSDEASGLLARVAGATDATLSRQGGAWRDGGASGDDRYSSLVLVPHALPGQCLAVAAGSYASQASTRFAGSSLPSHSGATAGVAAARDATTGAAAWAVDLGEGVLPAAAAHARSAALEQGVVVIAGRVTNPSNGVDAVVGGTTATTLGAPGGASDAVVALLHPATGAVLSASTTGSAGSDSWTCVVAAGAAVDAASQLSSYVALGGSSAGAPSNLDLPAADAAPSAPTVGIVAVYDSAEAATAAATLPVLSRAFGHATDAVTAAVHSLALAGGQVATAAANDTAATAVLLVAGEYSGGRLRLSSSVELAAPGGGETAVFIAALSLQDGSTLWGATVEGAGALAGSAVLAHTANEVVVCSNSVAGEQRAQVTAMAAVDGAVMWQTSLSNCSCSSLAATGEAGGTVAIVGASSPGAVVVAQTTGPEGRVVDQTQRLTSDGQRGLLVKLNAATGAWTSGELFGTADAGASTGVAAVAGHPWDGGSTLLVAGHATGAVQFGRPPALTSAPASGDTTTADALLARFRPVTAATAEVPVTLYRDGGGADEEAVDVAARSAGFTIVGSVAARAAAPGAVAKVAGQAVADAATVTALQSGARFATLQVVAKASAAPLATSTVVVGPSWGVDGHSTWAGVAAVDDDGTVLAAGHVRTSAPYLELPLADTPNTARVLHAAGTDEPLVAAFDASGATLWALASRDVGGTSGNDQVIDVEYDVLSHTAAVLAASDAMDRFMCGNDFGAAQDHKPACTSAQLTLLVGGSSSLAAQPSTIISARVGGDGVTTTPTDLSMAPGGSLLVSGVFQRSASAAAPRYLQDGLLYIPGQLLPVASDLAWDYVAGAGVTLEAPSDGSEAAWVAAYDARSGTLLWASLVAASGHDGDSARVAGVAATGSSALLCGDAATGAAAAANWTVHTGTAVSDAGAVTKATLSIDSATGTDMTPPAGGVFVTALDIATGAVQWVQWVTASEVASSGVASVACSAGVAASRSGVVAIAGAVSGTALEVSASAVTLPLPAQGTDAAFVAQFTEGDGSFVAATLLQATAPQPAPQLSRLRLDDELRSLRFVAVGAVASVGPIHTTTALSHAANAFVGTLSGANAVPRLQSAGSKDALLVAIPVATVGTAQLPTSFAVATQSPVDTTTASLDSAGALPSGTGLGFNVGVSVGRQHTMTVGYFKGTLALDGDGGSHTVVAAGDVGTAGHEYDSLAVVYGGDMGREAITSTVRLSGISGATDDDRFRAAAATPLGTRHFVVGHATVPTPLQVIGIGALSVALPGAGGRDGFLAAFADANASAVWFLPVGATSAADDALVAVATDGASVVAGGEVTSVVPGAYGTTTTMYDGSIGSRTLATVYMASASDGSELWGRAFGTVEDGGVAQTMAVGVMPDGSGVVIAGAFMDGSLQLDATTLAPMATGNGDRTAFVAMLTPTGGSLVWARAAVTGSGAIAGSFSIARGLGVSAAAVVVAGEFRSLGAPEPYLELVDPEQAGSIQVDAPLRPLPSPSSDGGNISMAAAHGFTAVLDASDGTVRALQVPSCPSGCRAGGVAVGHGRAFVAYTFQGRAAFGTVAGDRGAVDAAAPNAQRAALVALSGAPGNVERVEVLGGGGTGNVAAGAVSIGRRGSIVALAGWRSGQAAMLQRSPAAATTTTTTTSNSLEFLPFVTTFNAWARTPPASSTSSAPGTLPVAFATSNQDLPSALVGPSSAALGRHMSITVATAASDTTVLHDDGTDVAGAGTAAEYGVVVLADRRSGAQLAAWGVVGANTAGAHSAVAAAAAPDGLTLCVAGTVDSGSTGDGSGALLGATATAASGGGGEQDVYLGCFPDQGTEPTWVATLGSASHQAATALAVSPGVAWVGYTTRGALAFAGTQVAHGGSGGASAAPRCVVSSFALGDGAELAAVAAVGGTAQATDACSIEAITASDDGTRVYVAGWFRGSPLVLSPSVTLTPTSSLHNTPYVACFEGPGGGRGNFSLAFASAGTFSAATYTPADTLFGRATSLALSSRGSDGGPDENPRLYISGTFASADLTWGVGLASRTTTSTAVDEAGSGDPSTAFVLALDATSGGIAWLASLPSSTRSGIVAAAGVAVASDGLLLAALQASSPVSAAAGSPALTAPVNASAARPFGVLVQLNAHSGVRVGGFTVSDPDPSSAAIAAVASLRLVSAPGSAAASSGADDIVLVGAARGAAVASAGGRQGVPAPGATAGDASSFMLFHTRVGSSSSGATTGVDVAGTDGSAVSDMLNTEYAVQFDLWRSESSPATAVVVGGAWRARAGTGAGVVFQLDTAQQAAQAAAPGQWVTVEGSATPVTVAPGSNAYGASGGSALLGSLRDLSLHVASTVADTAAQWRVRNVKLVPRAAECVPCGIVTASVAAVNMERASQPLWVSDSDVALLPVGDAVLPQLPVDVTTLVDPTCACLAGAEVAWEEQLPLDWTPEGAAGSEASPSWALVTGVTLSGASGSTARVSTTRVTRSAPAASSRDNAGHLWRAAAASIQVQDHVRASEMDWAAVSTIAFTARVPGAQSGDAEVPAGHVRVRNVQVRRACAPVDVLLHPLGLDINSTVEVQRGGLGLTRGESYRVISYETNMWGDSSTPTCSRDFVADDTAPTVADAVVVDVLPEVGASSEDQNFTRHSILKVGWSGVFEEPDSAPDNILLFRIMNVTVGAVDGWDLMGIQGVPTEENLLATTSTGHVQTSEELPLEDGEAYFVHLGVCNRGKLCTTAVSTTGIIHDSSAPQSAAIRVVDANVTTLAPPLPVHHQRDDLAIHALWAAFEDPHTWVTELRVGLGTADFGTDVHELVLVPNTTTSFSFGPKTGDATLLLGQAYYVVLSATNVAGASQSYRTAPLYIDQTPPQVQWVLDVLPEELTGVESYYEVDDNNGDVDLTDGSIVRAKFHCDDPESVAGGTRGNMTYRWRVCAAADCSALYADWMDVGQTPRGSTNDTVLRAAREAGTLQSVYVQVECTNPVGLTTTAISNGAVFDDTPPSNASAIVADFDPRAGASRDVATGDVDFLPNVTLHPGWSGFLTLPGRPPLLDYQLAIGSLPGIDDVVAYHSVGLATEVIIDRDSAPLQHGGTYFATVRAVTTAGASSTQWSNGVTLDWFAPSFTVRDVAPDHLDLTHPDRCAAHLRCMALSGATEDIEYIPTTTGFSLLVPASTHVAPLGLVEYGVSTCGDATLLDLNTLPLQAALQPTDSRFDHGSMPMSHGQRYCAVVFQTSVTGLAATNASNGVLVDITPPVPRLVHEGASAEFDDDAVASTSDVQVTVACHDTESGIHHVEVRVSHVSFGDGAVLDTALNWTVVSDSSNPPGHHIHTPGAAEPLTVSLTGLSLSHGEWYVTSVRCVNRAGAYADLDSDGFVVDMTPPDATGAEVHHSRHHVAVQLQVERGVIEAAWSGFWDGESRVASFAWAIGTSPHGTEVQNVTNVGAATTATAGPGLDLQDGMTYYVTVYATNLAGLVASTASGGVTVDGSAPGAPQLVVHLDHADAHDDATAVWLASTQRVELSWLEAAEDHTNVTYRWALGTERYGQQVVPWTSSGGATSATATGLALVAGMPYYASVEAVNEAGLSAAAASVLVRADPHLPVRGTVVHGASVQHVYRAQDSTSRLECAWTGFTDALSGVYVYRVAYGTAQGTADVETWAAVQAGTNTTFAHAATGLSLTPGAVYYCTVVAFDRAGNSALRSSSGVVVDTSAAVAGEVLDLTPGAGLGGSGALDVDYHTDRTRVRGSWPGWHDDESGLTRLEWAVGSTAGGTDVSAWMHVPTHRTQAEVVLSSPLAIGSQVFVTVRVWNGVGMVTQASSDGMQVLAEAHAGLDVVVRATVRHIPAHTTTFTEGASWCSCGDPEGSVAASGAVYNPTTGACSCGPNTFLNGTAGDGAGFSCVPCPAGTCKHGLGNAAEWCTVEACSDGQADAVAPAPPTPAAELSPCGAAGHGRVTRPSDGACVCPAGTRADAATGECVACPAGTSNPWLGDVAECSLCWQPLVPDTVLHVAWDLGALAQGGAQPTALQVSVGTSAGALRWVRTLPGNATWAQFHSRAPPSAMDELSGGGSPPLRQGSALHVRVRALVEDLVVGDAGAVAHVVDLSPPARGVVLLGSIGGVSGAVVLRNATALSASWYGFEDAEWVGSGGIARYAVAFGSQGPNSTNLSQGWLQLEGAQRGVNLTLATPLAEGTVVHATVRAYSPTSAWVQAASAGVPVQTVVPAGTVGVVAAAAAGGAAGEAAMRHQSALEDAWSIGAVWRFQPAAGPMPVPLTFEWAVRDADSGVWVLPYTSVGAATTAQHTIARVPGAASLLTPGRRYAVTVRATNGAGVSREVTSPTTIIDATPPQAASVNVTRVTPVTVPYTEPERRAGEAAFQVSTSALGVEWRCYDDEVDVVNATVVIGSVVGGDQGRLASTVAHTDTGAVFSDLNLVHGHCYVAQVACTSEAALRSSFAASAPMCVDTTEPQASATVLHPGLVVAFIDDYVGLDTGYDGLSLAQLVQASSPTAAGLDAAHVAAAVPYVPAALAAYAGDSMRGEVPASALLSLPAVVAVRSADAESGIVYTDLRWAAGELIVLDPTTSLDLLGDGVVSGNVSYAQLGVASGAAVNGSVALSAHWRAYNGAGHASEVTTDSSLVIDTTAPVPANSSASGLQVPAGQQAQSRVEVGWGFEDPDSGILGYVWGVTTINGSAVVAPTWVGSATSVAADGLALIAGESYVISVTACNHALMCTTESATMAVDVTAPVTGTVYLGDPSPSLLASLCSSQGCAVPSAQLAPAAGPAAAGAISWGGFVDAQSAIISYRVALGTSPGGTQLGPTHTVHMGPPGAAQPALTVDLALLAHSDPTVLAAVMYHGATLWVGVTATNAVGLRSTVVAPLLRVDALPPGAGVVTFVGSNNASTTLAGTTPAGFAAGGMPRAVQRDSSQATVRWSPFACDDCSSGGLPAYVVSLVDEAGSEVASVPVTVSSNMTMETTLTELALQPGVAYGAKVAGEDAAGNVIVAHSQHRLVVDDSPPVQVATGRVRDGAHPRLDIDCQAVTGTASVDDVAGTVVIDARSGVVVYGPQNETQATALLASLNEKSNYGKHTVTEFTFDPFHDPESGVVAVQVKAVNTWVALPVGHTGAVRLVTPLLQEGATVQAQVRAVNGAGLWSEVVRSDGVRMLCEPGTAGCDYDGLFLCVA